MLSALDDLAASPPTEFGGANAATGLGYQRNWTICLLIELHKANADYLVVCDYHDDILVLEGGVTAEKIDFYQVKTTNKRLWTIKRLVTQEKAKNGNLLPSVLGKLFRHKLTFKERTRKLVVVCNLPYSIETEEHSDVTEERFTFEALSNDDRQTIVDRIKQELAITDSPEQGVSLIFMVSTLNLKDHENGTRGRLEELLRNMYPFRDQFPIQPIYRVLADEIERLSKNKDSCRSVTDLISLKGFQRRQLDKYVVSCIQEADRRNPERLIAEVMEELRADNMPILRRKKITQALATFALERLDQGRLDLAKLKKSAIKYIASGPPEDKFIDILHLGLQALRQEKEANAFSDEYLMAIIAWEVLTDGWELPAASAQPEEED